jgi:hypothetical protein
MATRQAGARLGRLATVLAAVITGLLLASAAATAAFANPIPIGDGGSVPITPVPPRDQRRRHGGLAGRPDPHRYHRLIRPPATTLHACLTTGPPGLDRQAGLRLPSKQIRQVMTTGARPGH